MRKSNLAFKILKGVGEMQNKYLERINRLYREIVIPNRVKFENDNWYKKNEKTNDWLMLKVYKGNQVSLSHSGRTSISVSHLGFLVNTQGPYTLEQLVDYMYEGVFHKYYGWVEGFWDKKTLLMYFQKLKKNNEILYEVYIRDNHGAFYKAIRRIYKGEDRVYRAFLIDMGENPDEISGNKLIDKSLQEGKRIEFSIIRLLKQLEAPYEYFVRFGSGNIPDIYDRNSHNVIDIKRSIKTGITKEIEEYSNEFNNVTVIYLFGSRESVRVEQGVTKMSVYKWICSEAFFAALSHKQQEAVIEQIDNIVKNIDEAQYISDVNDYHRTLVEQIIHYDKNGLINREIAEKVGISDKYVNRILRGTALKEYSGDYPQEYIQRQKDITEEKEQKGNKVVKLFFEQVTIAEIAERLYMSTDMVKYYLANMNLNQKVLISNRNEKIHKLLSTFTSHETLNEKFRWIVSVLKEEYSGITFGAVRNYYYTYFLKKEGNIKIIKGKEDNQTKVIELFHSGKSTSVIAQILTMPVTSVRSYLRKSKLGKKDILSIRNEKIRQLLNEDIEYKTLELKFESIVTMLKEEYPDISIRTIKTYYYDYYLKV